MYTYLTDRTSNNSTSAAETPGAYGMKRVVEGITIHHWGDPNLNPQFDSVVNYLCRANGNTSAHYVATGTGRKVACIVSPDDTAWHSGSAWGNARTIGIELDPRARTEDFDVAAELIADIRSAYGDVPLYWHSYFVATSCPEVYRDKIDYLDQLSYTKYSDAVEWGKGGNKSSTPVTPPIVPPAQTTVLYKLSIDGKQVAAYSTDANAFKGFQQYGGKGYITYGSEDVTQQIIAKFQTPSPSSQDSTGNPLPDTGKPVTEKHDYTEEDRAKMNTILEILNWIKELLTKIFKG